MGRIGEISKSQLLYCFYSLILFIIIVASSLNERINSFSLYVLIPFLSIYSILRLRKKISTFRSLIILFLLYAWMLLTGFVSGDFSAYLQGVKTMTGVVLFCVIIYCFAFTDKKYIFLIYFLFCCKFLYFFYYSTKNGLWETNIIENRMRIEGINANTFGYFSFFAVSSSFFILLNCLVKFKKFLSWILVTICITTGLVAVFFAASRAGFIITIASSILFLVFYFLYPLQKKSIIFILIGALLMALLQPTLSIFFNESVLASRFIEYDNDIRIDLFNKGIQLGLSNPIFGIGAGNYSSTHSSFSELFASHGFIGLFLFIFLLIEAVKRCRELYLMGSLYRKYSLFFFAFFVIYFFYNFFYWFYLNLFLLGFFFLVRAHLESIIIAEEDNILN